jgi:hypothetical protein
MGRQKVRMPALARAPAEKTSSKFTKKKAAEEEALLAAAQAANSKSTSPDPMPPPQEVTAQELLAAFDPPPPPPPPPPPTAPPPQATPTFADAARNNNTSTMKIQPELREALKAAGLLSTLGLEDRSLIPYGTQATASDGHTDVRSYPTYGNYSDISALAEGCSGWLRIAMMRAKAAVLVVRVACSLPSVLLLAGVPSDRALASQTKGRLRRTHVVQQIAPHSLPTPTRRFELPEITARPVHKVSGKADAVLQFARDQNLRFAQETRFGDELHVMVDLSKEQAVRAITHYHLLAMEELLLSKTVEPEFMLTIDFERHIDARRSTDILNEIARNYAIFAAVTSFRGRLFFGYPPTEQIIKAIFDKYNGAVKIVRVPFAASAKQRQAPQAPEADEAVVPDFVVQGPAVLLAAAGALPPNYVDSVINNVLGPAARLLTYDGRTALVAVAQETVAAVDGAECGPIRIFDFSRVRRDRDVAREKMRASLERHRA